MERYIDRSYSHYLYSEVYFQYKLPFDPSDFVHFWRRVSPEGMEKIFKACINLFDSDQIRRAVKEVRVDTTVQEKNITFPTDRKLIEKVIEHCKRLANKENIKLTQTFRREIKKLKHQLRFARKPKNMTSHKRAQRRLHRIAFKIYQDVVKQLNPIPGKSEKSLMFFTGY